MYRDKTLEEKLEHLGALVEEYQQRICVLEAVVDSYERRFAPSFDDTETGWQPTRFRRPIMNERAKSMNNWATEPEDHAYQFDMEELWVRQVAAPHTDGILGFNTGGWWEKEWRIVPGWSSVRKMKAS